MIPIDIVAGARPNFVKAGPVYTKLKGTIFDPRFVHTGQHGDKIMSSNVISAVGLPRPDISLGVNKMPGVPYTASMINSYHRVLLEKPVPKAVIVFGDTDSSLAAAYATKRHKISLVHIESGMFGDPNEAEEINRRMIDSVSDVLLTTTYEAEDTLKKSIHRGIVAFVGNVMIDAIRTLMASDIWEKAAFVESDIMVTLHRPRNVDNEKSLSGIVHQLDQLHSDGHRIMFPVHPRTRSNLNKFGIRHRPYMFPPMPYLSFIKSMSRTGAIITDSGGVQPESAFFKLPCIAVRESTGWKNLVSMGWVTLTEVCNIYSTFCSVIHETVKETPEGFDGFASTRVSDVLDMVYFKNHLEGR